MKEKRISITVHNDIRMINVVLAGAVSYARILGFDDKECRHIELILEEVLTNLIKYDYMPGQDECIDVSLEPTTLGLGIRIHSNGVPLDVVALKNFENVTTENILESEAHGLGMLLIKKFADEVVYSNRGKEGQEVWIEKYLPEEHVKMSENEILPESAKSEEKSKVDFYVRRALAEESPVISRLAYYAYNLSYIYDQIYFPERVKQLNESNELMSYVAVNKSNEDIIGHCALIREEISDFVEMGVAFVNPAYRGSGCLTDLSQIMLEDVEKMSFTGVFAHAVTTHNYSQKVIANFGFKESALLISRVSALQMNKINTENTTRDSLLYQCKYIDRPHLSKIFTPVHHHNMIVKILQNLGVDPLVGSVAEEVTLKDQDQPRRCMIETKTDAYACAHIFVKQYGNDIQLNVGKTLKSLCVDRIETVYLFLPLEFPETSIHCKDFEALGFFFSGVKPAKGHKAWLLLQYLNNQSYDYNKLVFCSDFGRELMSYIRKCDPNCEME